MYANPPLITSVHVEAESGFHHHLPFDEASKIAINWFNSFPVSSYQINRSV